MSIVKTSNHRKRVSLTNQKYTISRTVINLHPNEYTEGLHYYSFVVNLDRCVGRCNTFNEMSNKVCVPNKTNGLNLIKAINQHDYSNK